MDEYIAATFVTRRIFARHRYLYPQCSPKIRRNIYIEEICGYVMDDYLWILYQWCKNPEDSDYSVFYEISESLFISGASYYIFSQLIYEKKIDVLKFLCAKESVQIRIADHKHEDFWEHYETCGEIEDYEALKIIYAGIPGKWLKWDRYDLYYNSPNIEIIIWILERVTEINTVEIMSLLSKCVENEDSENATALIRRFPDIFTSATVEAQLRRSFCLASAIIASIRAADKNVAK